MLVSFEEKMNNEEKMKLYIESLVHCSISNIPDLLHLLHLLVASPYDSLLLKQCLHMISLEEADIYMAALKRKYRKKKMEKKHEQK